MDKLDKITAIIKAMQTKFEQLTIDVNIGDYWTIEVNYGEYWNIEVDYGNYWTIDVEYGDFWTLHKELAAVAGGKPQARLVDELGISIRNIERSGRLDQLAYHQLQSQLQDIIVWLEKHPVKA